MQVNSKAYLAVFIFSLVAVPICAAHTDSVSWKTDQPVTIGTVQVKPGNYVLKADESQDELDIIQNGKVVTTTLCYWEALPSKAANTEVKVDNDSIDEVQFKGRSEAIVFFGQ